MKVHSSGEFPSRLAIGDECALNLGIGVDPIPGKIVRVGFNESKVLYDVAIILDGEPYLAYPLRDVDSIFCSPPGNISSFPNQEAAHRVAASSLFNQLNNVLEMVMATSDLDSRMKDLRRQLQDAKRTGDKDWADELEQELNDLQHQKEGDAVNMKASTSPTKSKPISTAARVLRNM